MSSLSNFTKSGINSSEIPSILCLATLYPVDKVGEFKGSSGDIFALEKFSLILCPIPITVPPVPTPATKPSMLKFKLFISFTISKPIP